MPAFHEVDQPKQPVLTALRTLRSGSWRRSPELALGMADRLSEQERPALRARDRTGRFAGRSASTPASQ